METKTEIYRDRGKRRNMNYKIASIDAHTWMIEEYDETNSVYMYLLEGEERALLLDTGFGTIPLKQIVEELTEKPYIVLNTHAHFDHIGGNYAFEQVYMQEGDREIYEEHRRMVMEQLPAEKGENNREEMLWFSDEPVFELGNRTLELIHTPGHSKGCICVLDKEAKRLFTGDTCCKADVLLVFEGSTSVTEYQKTVKKLIDRRSDFSITWPSHHACPVSPDILDEFQEAADLLISGKETGHKEMSPFGEWIKFDYKDIGIAYNKIWD